MPVIPPPSHATVQNKENSTWHDKIVEYIKDKGTVMHLIRNMAIVFEVN